MIQKIIPNFPDYRVTEDGTIFCISRNKTVKPFLSSSGYWAVNLRRGDFVGFRYIHRLVLESFVSSCPEGLEARHLDTNKNNNHLRNLCWDTHTENMKDGDKVGKYFDADLRIFRKAI